MARAADDLIGTVITVPLMHEGQERRQGKTRLTMVSRCDYLPKEGAVELQFNEWLLPYIKELKGHYKELQLPVIMQMKSTYGIRLYELIQLWEWQQGSDGCKEILLAEFKQLLQIEKLYRDVRDLKSRVINPAVRDVNQCSGFSLTVGYRKVGRTITHIQFRIVRKVTAATEVSTPRTGRKRRLADDHVAKHARPGESRDQARTRLAASPE